MTMTASAKCPKPSLGKASARLVLLAATFSLLWSASACAFYVGDSFLNIPGSPGHWGGREYKHWIRADANDWTGILRRISSAPGDPLAGDKLYFAGPGAPRPGGPGKLTLSMSKDSPDLALLMAECSNQTVIP